MHNDTCKVVAIIAAAGSGKRIGGDSPKQYLKITNKPILIYTLEKFDRCNDIDHIILVVQKDKVHFAEDLLKQWQVRKNVTVITGGAERQDSIHQALHVVPDEVEFIVIHDAVRPFVSVQKLNEVIQAGREFGAAVLAVPEKNTVKAVKNGWVEQTLSREKLWEVQTPQVFRADWLKTSYVNAEKKKLQATDDAALVERMGYRVRLVEGEETNIKITSPVDLKIAETLIQNGYG